MGCSRSRIDVIECFDVEEIEVDGIELICDLITTDGVIVHDLTIVLVGADSVVVSLGSQSTKLY